MIRLKRLFANGFKQLQSVELSFPDSGRFLIQGRNEAGKSTLFEAIYFALFGQVLITESGGKGLADAVRYGHESCRVELDLEIRGRLFKIERGIKVTRKRDKNSGEEKELGNGTAGLTILSGDAETSVQGPVAVNTTLVRELGFDAEALLNTCFVEQKKLEKLESIPKAKREEALSKLLNLDALLALEDRLKLHTQDERLLARHQSRAELAQAQFDLPPVEEELALHERELKLSTLKTLALSAAGEGRHISALDAELAALAPRAAELARQAECANTLRDALREAQHTLSLIERGDKLRAAVERERAELAAQEQSDRIALANAGIRLPLLRKLALRARRLERVQAILASAASGRAQAAVNAERARAELARIDALSEQIVAEQARIAEFNNLLHDLEVGRALDAWTTAFQSAQSTLSAGSTLQVQRQARRALENRAHRGVLYTSVALVVGLLVAALAVVAALFAPSAFVPILAVAGGLFLLGLVAAVWLMRRVARDFRELSRLAQEVGQLEQQAATQAADDQASEQQRAAAIASLERLGEPVPADLSFSQARRVELAARLGAGSPEEWTRGRDEADINSRTLQREAAELAAQNPAAALAGAAAALASCERVEQRAKRLLAHFLPAIGQAAAAAGCPSTFGEINRALDLAHLELDQVSRRVSAYAARVQSLDERSRAGESDLRSASETLTRIEASSAVPREAESAGDVTVEAVTAYGKRLRLAYDAAGGQGATEQSKVASAELSGKTGERRVRAARLADLWRQVVGLATTLDVECTPDLSSAAAPPVGALDDFAQAIEAPDESSRESLSRRVKKLSEERGRLRGVIGQLDAKLQAGGEILDVQVERAHYTALEHEHQVRMRAADIASRTRKRIVRQVLPATMDYMNRLLPQLTRERYHEAVLDPETFRIQTWDERAGRMKEKNIFSGGTKDQFSLALRLAFALATLPQERGSAPGFIFLDEPLGSFDDERADALLDLLTEGEIGRAFDQIFLVSHVRVREDRFTHRVVLDGGRVLKSTLDAEDQPE